MYYSTAKRVDPRSLDLRSWAQWYADGKPLAFSIFGDSAGFRPFEPQQKHRHREASVLWQEGERFADEHINRMMRIDSVVHGAFSASERRLLLASVAPSGTGAPIPLSERARLVGASPDTLRGIRRRALDLIG